MRRILLYCLLGQILPAFLLYAEEKGHMRAALALKSLSSLYFVLLGLSLMSRCQDPRYAHLILAGLVLGMAGDILLNLCHLIKENRPVFLLGGTLFLAGHILYLIALLPAVTDSTFMLITAALIFLCDSLYVFYHSTGDRVFRILMAVYLLAVVLVTAAGIAFLRENPGLRRAQLAAAGALFFLLSDTFLCKNMLNNGRYRFLRFSLMILYYLGQTLIALSLG